MRPSGSYSVVRSWNAPAGASKSLNNAGDPGVLGLGAFGGVPPPGEGGSSSGPSPSGYDSRKAV